MRFFSGHLPAALPACAALVFSICLGATAAPQDLHRQIPSPSEGTKPKPKQKPASELIGRQAKPQTVPRVLERANPDNTRIFISLGKQRAYLLVGDEMAIDTPISSGKRAGMTPKGSFTLLEKSADHRSNIYGSFVNKRGEVVRAGVSTRVDTAPSGTRFLGAPMKWFMRMTWQGVGMHVGILPGYPASHGCIRMPDDIAKMFYDRVKIGTPVVVGD